MDHLGLKLVGHEDVGAGEVAVGDPLGMHELDSSSRMPRQTEPGVPAGVRSVTLPSLQNAP